MEKEKLDWEDFKDQFHISWHKSMKPAIESEWMFNIYKKIKEDAKKDIICPLSNNVFRSFKNTDKNKIKSIWWLMDPYPRKYKNGTMQATGVPMDCSNTPDGKLQPSLDIFYDGISKDLGKEVERSKSLDYLLEQGVLLLNTDLTVKLNKTCSHEGLWEPFQRYLLEEVMYGTSGIVYVLSGKSSQKLECYINPLGNYIFKIEHPAAAAHKHTDWETKNIFNKTNQIIVNNKGPLEKIFWDKEEYNEEPPF